ncbi:MAG: hypothetical protein JWN70_948 [Planctomycetaceae bacterium]|nr:hypothetical protein [Planctomycetaceae bacterium]
MPQNCAALLLTIFLSGVLGQSTADAQTTTTPTAPQKSKFEMMTEGARPVQGMWNMYLKEQNLMADIQPGNLNKNYLILVSIAKGISHNMVLGGMTWGGGGDDVLWQFRKSGDKILVVQRNVRFKATPGTPEGTAVSLAYSDSVLYALPILSPTPTGGSLVDLTRIFFSDDQHVGQAIGPGFFFASDRSTWAKAKAFEHNVELEVSAVYSGGMPIETVADSRGVQVNIHYSISELPSNAYRPRKADDRVGYFLTVMKDFSDKQDDQQFVRYINRWDLRKKDATASLSPPEKRIEFYIEKTVPVHLRPIVRSGILEWNKAFEKLGYDNAIVVHDQADDDTDHDPEDVRYNFFRWITADAGFAMGPSRVNPLTGQILDADIIFDAGFMQHWSTEWETLGQPPQMMALMGGEGTELSHLRHQHEVSQLAKPGKETPPHFHLPGAECSLCTGMKQQMAFAGALLYARGESDATGKLPEAFIKQALKEVVMHEVGHTLGLRHNFKASTWKSLAEISDPAKAGEPTVASVMDYSPTNIAAKGVPQGAYYTPTIGPYDHWAIEYGYKNLGDEDKELLKIASRASEPGLDYGTDEDTRGTVDSDPLANRFDLGNDANEFARRQMALAQELMPELVKRSVQDGQGYQRARQAFGMLLSEYWRTALFAARLPGGIYVARDHKGDPNARAPFRLVEPEKQRAAMKLLTETAFNPPAIPPDILNFLAATRWSHWGINEPRRLDYPIHDTILKMQSRILGQLVNVSTLTRLYDSELKAPPEADVYTLAEHMRLIVDGVYTEWKAPVKGEYTVRKPLIGSYRRNLQRIMLKEFAFYVNSPFAGVPEETRTLSRFHLKELEAQITAALGNAELKLDDYSKAHLIDCQERIRKALAAQVSMPSID